MSVENIKKWDDYWQFGRYISESAKNGNTPAEISENKELWRNKFNEFKCLLNVLRESIKSSDILT